MLRRPARRALRGIPLITRRWPAAAANLRSTPDRSAPRPTLNMSPSPGQGDHPNLAIGLHNLAIDLRLSGDHEHGVQDLHAAHVHR
jgi:hypothetical protein